MPSRMRFKHRKTRRREHAEELAALRAAKSDTEQLALLDDRPGESFKERLRLEQRIKESKKEKNTKNAGKSEHGSIDRHPSKKSRKTRNGESKTKE